MRKKTIPKRLRSLVLQTIDSEQELDMLIGEEPWEAPPGVGWKAESTITQRRLSLLRKVRRALPAGWKAELKKVDSARTLFLLDSAGMLFHFALDSNKGFPLPE